MLHQFKKLLSFSQIYYLVILAGCVVSVPHEVHAQDAIKPPPTLAPATPQKPPDTSASPSSFDGSATLSEFLFGKDDPWDKTYDKIEAWKKEYHLPISIGANHWFHLDRDERIYGNGYGVPTESGTYYWYIGVDPALTLGDGLVKEVGAHVQFRFRDDENDKLRAFYYDTYWFYEAYAYARTSVGTFKAGELVTQFGLPWDGTWWEGVPYFDGYKFDPDYGVSWENSWKLSDRFTIDSVAQFFFASNKVSGAILNADAESTRGLNERNTGVVRVIPTWKLNNDVKLQWGVSALVGGIKGDRERTDSSRSAFGTDLTLTWKNLSVLGEYIDGFGVTTPARYVSGGPSDRVDSLRGWIAYKYGPATFRANYSRGWDHNPSGHQYVLDTGVTLQLTKNVTFYGEYVKWDVTNRNGVTAKYDDGFELILVWNL
ncbi:MAG: hypothetical protein ACR2FX_12970 [Chthoniobacterales bacterium]